MIIPSTCKNLLAVTLAASAFAGAACATPFVFSTGDPDGKIATGSRPSSAGKIEIESANDFVLRDHTRITKASFTGLLPDFKNVGSVVVEIYRVFPFDSTNPPSGERIYRRRGPVSGQEVRFEVAFTTLFDLPASHYFFIPQVRLTTGDFL